MSSLAAGRWGSRLQNGSGCGENACRALVGDFLFGLEPVLNVPTAEGQDQFLRLGSQASRVLIPGGNVEPAISKH